MSSAFLRPVPGSSNPAPAPSPRAGAQLLPAVLGTYGLLGEQLLANPDPLPAAAALSGEITDLWTREKLWGLAEGTIARTLVGHAAKAASPGALAIAALMGWIWPEPALRHRAHEQASIMAAAGVPVPAFWPSLGAVTLTGAFCAEDAFGEQCLVVLEARLPTRDRSGRTSALGFTLNSAFGAECVAGAHLFADHDAARAFRATRFHQAQGLMAWRELALPDAASRILSALARPLPRALMTWLEQRGTACGLEGASVELISHAWLKTAGLNDVPRALEITGKPRRQSGPGETPGAGAAARAAARERARKFAGSAQAPDVAARWPEETFQVARVIEAETQPGDPSQPRTAGPITLARALAALGEQGFFDDAVLARIEAFLAGGAAGSLEEAVFGSTHGHLGPDPAWPLPAIVTAWSAWAACEAGLPEPAARALADQAADLSRPLHALAGAYAQAYLADCEGRSQEDQAWALARRITAFPGLMAAANAGPDEPPDPAEPSDRLILLADRLEELAEQCEDQLQEAGESGPGRPVPAAIELARRDQLAHGLWHGEPTWLADAFAAEAGARGLPGAAARFERLASLIPVSEATLDKAREYEDELGIGLP